MRYFDKELSIISVPFTKQQVVCLFQNKYSWATGFSQFWGQTDNHFPTDQLLQFSQINSFIFSKVVMKDHLKDAMLVRFY